MQGTKFQEFFFLLKIQASSHLRPKTLSISVLLKNLEEIYSARYKKETQTEEKLRKSEDNTNFSEFVAEFLNEKYKNKRMTDQNALDLCQSIETYESENVEVRIFSNFLSQILTNEILIFFLYVRNTVSSIVNLQLIPSNN